MKHAPNHKHEDGRLAYLNDITVSLMGKNSGWSRIHAVVPPEVAQHLANSVPPKAKTDQPMFPVSEGVTGVLGFPKTEPSKPAMQPTKTKHISPAKPRKGKAKNK